MTDKKEAEGKKPETFVETIEIAGTQVLDEVKRLIKEGNVRRLHIKGKDSDFHMEMPMTVGILVGGAMALAAPWLAILGVVGGLIAKVTIEIEREKPTAPAEEEPASITAEAKPARKKTAKPE